MATQRCPQCGSNRVRRGYRSTSVFWKLLLRYNLLCDNCNLEFNGFAIPGTVSSKPTKNPNKQKNSEKGVEGQLPNMPTDPNKNSIEPFPANTGVNVSDVDIENKNRPIRDLKNRIRVKKKIKVRL